jgi:hypothetical protein
VSTASDGWDFCSFTIFVSSVMRLNILYWFSQNWRKSVRVQATLGLG